MTDVTIPTLHDEVFRKEARDLPPLGAQQAHRYFEALERKQTEDLLAYLVEFSDQPIVLHGPEGVGKTTLIEIASAKSGNTWRVCQLAARRDLIAPETLLLVARALEVELPEEFLDEALQQLAAHVLQLARQGQRLVIVVDDAELMSAEAMEMLLQLFHGVGKPGEALALVFSVNDQPQGAGQISFGDLPVASVELMPFSAQEARRYIEYLADHHKQPAWASLDEASLNAICQQGAGLPARINALLKQPHLRASVPRPASASRAWVWVLLLIVLAAAAAAIGLGLV